MDTASIFNIPALEGWLSDVAGLVPPLTLERIDGGQSNLTFVVTDSTGRQVVVRQPPLGGLVASAHNVLREGRIMAALADTPVPVPTIFGASDVTRPGAVSDQPTIAMSFVPGVTANSRRVVDGMSPTVRRATASSLIDAMTAVHQVDLVATGLADVASTDAYAPRQLRRWTKQWDKSKTRELPELESLTERLHAAVPQQTETTLVHGDLHLGNLLVDPADGSALAVVDWELATLGDPLADIGSLLAYWPVRNGPQLPGFDAALAEGFPTPEELATMYFERTGRDINALGFWHVLGVWKVAIIVEGVVRRSLDRPENANRAGVPTPQFVEMLVAYATQLADRYAL